tara:strand:- start:63 stop:407 length:345 start_codon:yes stop_codon:yes gene_type:complete
MFSVLLLGSCTQQQSPSQICDKDLVGYWLSSNNGGQGEPRIMFIGADLTGNWVNPNFANPTFGGTFTCDGNNGLCFLEQSHGFIGTYTLNGNSLTLTINQSDNTTDMQTWDFVK